MIVPKVRRLVVAVTAAAAVVACGAVLAMAVTPKGGAYLRGETAAIDETNGRPHAVGLKVAGGVRSAKAIAALQENGYTGKLVNVKGGITAWSDEVDASVPKY